MFVLILPGVAIMNRLQWAELVNENRALKYSREKSGPGYSPLELSSQENPARTKTSDLLKCRQTLGYSDESLQVAGMKGPRKDLP
jgi:hypothetical protein